MALEKQEEIKVTHPDFGHVVFTGMSGRQAEVLDIYQKVFEAKKGIPNDKEFGQVIRALLS